MILSWMAYAAFCAALCAVVGLCVDTALRNRLQQRRVIWMLTMLASVVLPLAIPLLTPTPEAWAVKGPRALPVDIQDVPEQATTVAALSRIAWNQLAMAVWIATSVLLMGSLVISRTGLRWRLRGYRRTNVDGQSILVSDDFGPAVVGLLRTIIVLPPWALTLADDQRKLVVTHEVEHQRAGDPALIIVALYVVALFPWNIALWWQLARLRLAVEFDCDVRVVARSGADPFTYGSLLLTAYENAGQSRRAALSLAPIRSALGKRVNALVVKRAHSKRRTLSVLSVAVLALAALGFAPVPPLPQRAPKSVAPSTAIDRTTSQTGVANASRTTRNTPDGATPRAIENTATSSLPSRILRDSPKKVVMRRGAAAGAMQPDATPRATTRGGGRGGSNRGEPSPLKTYTGGFMNAEVPARVDSLRPFSR